MTFTEAENYFLLHGVHKERVNEFLSISNHMAVCLPLDFYYCVQALCLALQIEKQNIGEYK
ncbi:MAG: hypothetical protein GY849_12065 [Deltaproteobacteria bacterium]|nr:hypothetical protein [Deltaproteobacteria bacterium]